MKSLLKSDGKREKEKRAAADRASAINLITVSGGRSGAAAAATAGTRSREAARRRSINRIRADADGQDRKEDIRWMFRTGRT